MFSHPRCHDQSNADVAAVCRVISKSFANDKTFQNTLNSAFEHFINIGQRAPEYISLYMDDRLRKGVKGVSDDNDIETTLDKVMILFRYLSEKDMFEKYYKQHLAKRLLSGRAVSLSSTAPMLPRLEYFARLT